MTIKRNIPNIISVLNLVVGFMAIWFVAHGFFSEAFYLLCTCLILDFLDGFFARLLNAKTSFGAQFDSFADLVSFGVLPGFFLMNYLHTLNAQFILILLSAIYPVTAAIRLVRFNLEEKGSNEYFTGIPTPISALLIMSLTHLNLELHIESTEFHAMVVSCLTVLVSLLMISKLKIINLKFQGLEYRTNKWRYLFIVLAAITFTLVPSYTIALIYVELILLSLLRFKI